MSAINHLARGRACIDCRRRKVKCDGALPACKRCVAGGHGLDCEYADERAKTRVQLLEDSIKTLEAKIAELQSPAPLQHPVLIIHVPGRGGFAQRNSDSPLRLVRPEPTVPPVSNLSLPDCWWELPELPLEISKLFMDYFALIAYQLGFFMHGPRLVQAMFPSSKQSELHLPSPNLVNAIYLWGIHLSEDERFLEHESTFLERAVQFDLKGQQSHHVVHNIQAEILLANYFLRRGKPSSAMHRLHSAISLCISYGLHKQASPQSAALRLPPPRDSVEQGERIDAFWAALFFYKLLSVQAHTSSRVSVIVDEMVDTPFSLEMSAYESGSVPANPRGILTLKSFLDAPGRDPPQSTLESIVKAASLYERARYFGVEWQSVLWDPEEDTQFRKFEQQLINFIQSFPHLSQFVGPYTNFAWLSASTLLQLAVIYLHSSRKHVDSNQKCLDAAHAAANMITNFKNAQSIPLVNPTMGHLWFTVCETLIGGIREMYQLSGGNVVHGSYEHLVQSLKVIIDAMEASGMSAQLMRVNTMIKCKDQNSS
ncbi:hypothetical protein GYMLUDRAFT_864514 [Collybiopsis luxurians FD-317 M1]|nr:hypothetical protein GYMLUDRAFT_864514 [Collybiopsis luxurians FD-317 M1]